MRLFLLALLLLLTPHASVIAQDDYSEDYIEADDTETGNVHSQEELVTSHTLIAPDQVEATRAYQDAQVVLRKFDDEKWKEITGDVDFNETEAPAPEESGPSSLSIPPWGGALFRVISYVVIIGVVIVLLYFIIRNISLDVKIRRTALATEDLEKPVENIESLDIQDLLERARREGNFRLAVRLSYLGLLKKLHELEIIAWKKDKTNRDYLGELFSRNFLFDEIRRLTISYESVWYGEHELKPESYRDLTAKFESVYHKLNNSGPHAG